MAVLETIAAAIRDRRPVAGFVELLNQSREPLFRSLKPRVDSPPVARALTLKILNLCLARHHFTLRGATVLSAPLGLVVDPINNCNLACPGCVHSANAVSEKLFQWNSGMLSEACFAELLKTYGPRSLEIMLCNYGEPTLNPLTPAFIRRAKKYLMRTALSTNMTAKRFDAAAYARSGLDFMTVSLDGATQNVYEKYRKKGDLDLAFRNIEALIAARADSATQTPVVSWQFLAFEHNAHEIDEAMTIARQLGVDQFVVGSPFDVSWDEPGIRPAKGVESRTVPFRSDNAARMTANWNPFADELETEAIDAAFAAGWAAPAFTEPDPGPGHTCHWLYRNMVMDANGRVIPCCAAPKASADLVFANISTEIGDNIFNSAKYRLARLSFADATAYPGARDRAGLLQDPHCVRCEWNQDSSHTDSAQVEQYFSTVGGRVFDRETIAALCAW